MKKPGFGKKKVIIGIVIIALVGGGIAYGIVRHNDNKSKPLGVGQVNYGPPTSAEKKETEQHKQQLENQQNNPSSDSKPKIGVVITYLSTTEARGYASGVFEDGGTCTLTLTKGSAKVTGTSTAVADVNKSTCGPISINQSQLSSGTWTAVLSYSSPSGSGSSDSQTLNVP
ncbi:MAG TPA: hypothetical protein VN554_01710 [Verrucomicrobiae bacterium]|nr:hypothetical protein [Verrucomicrobiae bacterium]